MVNSRVESDPAAGPVLAVWRALAEHAEASIAVVGPDAGPQVVVWVNRTALDLLGVGSEELVGRSLPDLRGGAGAGWCTAAGELLTSVGGRCEATLRRFDGQTLPADLVVTPVLDAGPSPSRTWLVALRPHADGTDEAAAALREAEHRFHALADHAPVGIVLSEAGLRLGYANGRFAEIVGTDPGLLLGTGWLDAVHSEDLPGLYEALQGVLGGETATVTVRLAPTPDGQRYAELHFSPTTTPQRAAGFVGTAEDVTDRRAWEEQIAYQANHDPLTGLVNRRRLVDVLSALLGSRRPRDREFALIFCDLDGFKSVNDRFGHAAGDRVLIEVARRLLRTAREDDLVCRVSGDEFVIVLRGVASAQDAEIAANRHLAALSAAFVVNRTELPLSASLGVALPASYDTAESLLQAADAVMYDAKASGPGTYRLASVSSRGQEPPDQDGTAAAAGPAGDGR